MPSIKRAFSTVFGVALFAMLLLPLVALAQSSIPQVAGPFSPYPPYSNPWTTDGWSANNPRVVTDTGSGVEVSRAGTATVTKDGIGVRVPVTAVVDIERASLARSIARAAAGGLGGPYGVALGIAIDYGLSKGVFQCATYTWCQNPQPDPNLPPPGRLWINGPATPTFKSPSEACAAKGFGSIAQSTPTSYYCYNGTFNYSGVIASQVNGVCQSGYAIQPDGSCKSTAPVVPIAASPPWTDSGFVPWLATGQGNTPGRSSPSLYDAARNEGGQPENPSVAGTSPAHYTAPPVTSSPTTTSRSNTTNADGTTSTVTVTEQSTVTPQQTGSSTGDSHITNYSINTVTTTTTVNNTTGATTTTVREDNPNAATDPNAAPVQDTGPRECGTPGKPKCQIDETGTPTLTGGETAKADAQKQVDTSVSELSTVATETHDTALGFSFDLPSASCTPFAMPFNIGAIDPCPAVDHMRTVFDYAWVLTTVWICIGMVKKAIDGV